MPRSHDQKTIPAYTQAEAARELGVSRARVQQMLQEGKVRPVLTAGGTRLVDAIDVNRLRRAKKSAES